jgi:16S rRNA (uracil1498-N3)-methyltransferase
MASGKLTRLRLFVERSRLTVPEQSLSSDDCRYLFRVHRLKAGDAFEVFDGQGVRHLAIVDPGLESATLGPAQAAMEPQRVELELWQGIPKADKLELIIQKATELGVARIMPLMTQRAISRVADERAAKRVTRWRRIAAEAARQCGRLDVPEVSAVRDFEAFLGRARMDVVAALVYEGDTEGSLWRFLSARLIAAAPRTPVVLAIGPEGGFAPEEVEAARRSGVPLLSLGVRILRTETAAIIACALALAASGGFD